MIEPNCIPTVLKIPIEQPGGHDDIQYMESVAILTHVVNNEPVMFLFSFAVSYVYSTITNTI